MWQPEKTRPLPRRVVVVQDRRLPGQHRADNPAARKIWGSSAVLDNQVDVSERRGHLGLHWGRRVDGQPGHQPVDRTLHRRPCGW